MNRQILRLRRLIAYLRFVWDKLSHRRGSVNDPERTNFYLQQWRKSAESIGAIWTALPDGFCSVSCNGQSTLIYQNQMMFDHPVSIALSRSKPLVLQMLERRGLPVPVHAEYTLDTISVARRLLAGFRGPAVVKPARGTAGGDGVTTNIMTRAELDRASIYASLFSHTLLIERQAEGDSYRLLYLDGELLDAIRRRPPTVTGDGRTSVRRLIRAENRRRAERNGADGLTSLRFDEDCRNTLRQTGLTLWSVPPAGMQVVVKLASNDNSSRDNESVTGLICDSIRNEGAAAAAIAGLRLAGVDIVTTDPGRPLASTNGIINEVNVTPGLHYHYLVNNKDGGTPVMIPVLQALLRDGATQKK